MRVKPSLAVEKIRIGTLNTPLSWNLPDDTLTRTNVGPTSALNPNSIRAKPDQSKPPILCLLYKSPFTSSILAAQPTSHSSTQKLYILLA